MKVMGKPLGRGKADRRSEIRKGGVLATSLQVQVGVRVTDSWYASQRTSCSSPSTQHTNDLKRALYEHQNFRDVQASIFKF
jgi:hypothetical protein